MPTKNICCCSRLKIKRRAVRRCPHTFTNDIDQFLLKLAVLLVQIPNDRLLEGAVIGEEGKDEMSKIYGLLLVDLILPERQRSVAIKLVHILTSVTNLPSANLYDDCWV